MNKVYSRIEWKNYEVGKTPLNETNLNKMDSALDEIDKRVVQQETTKANKSELNELIKSFYVDEKTGIITLYKVSGEQIIFDLNIEKIPVGFSMTEEGILTMITDDGTVFTADIGSMIPVFTFEDSAEIAFEVTSISQVKKDVENETFLSEENAEGIVYASSSYSYYNHAPYKAFDGNGTTAWICDGTVDASGQYLIYNFSKDVYPSAISLFYKSQNSSVSFIVQGCKDSALSDDNEWVNLSEEISFAQNGSSEINIQTSSDTPYKMFRVYITGGVVNVNVYTIIYEIKIRGYEYEDAGGEKIIKASIKTGSITEDKLQPNFLADCRLYAGNAENSAVRAEEYAEQARESAEGLIVDSELSETSENPVQNKVLTKALGEVDTSLDKLYYADYQAGNYDPKKNYHIPDFPYSNGKASQIEFDDTNAQLGADDVQGAIEEVVGKLKDLTLYRNYVDVTLNENGDATIKDLTEDMVKIVSVQLVDTWGDISLVRITSNTNWGVHSTSLKSQTVRIRYLYFKTWALED